MASVEVQMSSCGAGPGGPPTSWCPPFSGANAAEAQHHNPTQPRLLRIFPLFFLSFSLSIHPPLPPCSFLSSFLLLLFPPCFILLSLSSFVSIPLCFFLLPLSSFVSVHLCFFLLPLSSLFHPLSISLLSFHPPTLPPLPSIDSRPLATLSSAILCLQLLCFQSEPPVSRHQKRIRLCRPSTKHKYYHLLQKPYVRRGDNRREESLWRAPRSGEL